MALKAGFVLEGHFLVKAGTKELSEMESNLEVIRSTPLIFKVGKKKISLSNNS